MTILTLLSERLIVWKRAVGLLIEQAAWLPGLIFYAGMSVPSAAQEEGGRTVAGDLSSGKFTITRSWSQETDYQRPYWVQVPENGDAEAELKPWPVLIFLHGNGGNAEGAQKGFTRRYPKLMERFITVFPEGYGKSWNIVSERSKADDRGFIESIVSELGRYRNVKTADFT
ncbi:MAG: hypothetical protein AAF514_12640, partial [Verrucomicrobiota bacterium]